MPLPPFFVPCVLGYYFFLNRSSKAFRGSCVTADPPLSPTGVAFLVDRCPRPGMSGLKSRKCSGIPLGILVLLGTEDILSFPSRLP